MPKGLEVIRGLMALQEQSRIVLKSVSILHDLYLNYMALAGSDQSSGTRTPLPVPSVLTPQSPCRVSLHPQAPSPAGSNSWSIWICSQALETLSTLCFQACETKRNAELQAWGLLLGKGTEKLMVWQCQWDVHSR